LQSAGVDVAGGVEGDKMGEEYTPTHRMKSEGI